MTDSTPRAVAADLVAVGLFSAEAAHGAVVLWTATLQRTVVRNASGTPVGTGPHGFGPNAVTGHYRRSINRQTTKRAHSSEGVVGTDAPQGRRLEFGFVGTDSLGRTYDQPPYPHFGPALDEVAEPFQAAIALIPGVAAKTRGV